MSSSSDPRAQRDERVRNWLQHSIKVKERP